MIRRVSVWKLHKSEDAEKMKEALLSMKGSVPSLYDIEVGVNMSEHTSAFDIVFIGTFEDEVALRAFDADPVHKDVGKLVQGLRERRVVVEYRF